MVSVGSVSVDVVPSAKGWVAKLRAQLLPEADALGLEIGRAISARINEALTNAHISVDVDTAAADAQLGITEAIVDRLDGRRANITADADTAAAEAKLAAFGAGAGSSGKLFNGIAGSINSATSAMSPLILAVAALGTALIPVVATAAGLAAALVLPLAAAGGGIGLGAVLAGFAIKNVEKTEKKIDQLKAKAATLRDPKARAEALKEAADLEKSLTGPQKAFLTAQGHLSAAFAKLQTGKVGDALFAPLVAGMNLLAKVMPALAPIIESVSGAITRLLSSLSKSASGKGFTDFVAGFAKLAGATITSAGKSIALFGQGLFNIFKDFLPLSASVGTGLTSLGQKFLDFSKKASTQQGIQSFINYVKANGPKVLAAIGQISVAFVRLGVALAPIGGKILSLITAIATGFNKIPTGLATGILSPIIGLGKAVAGVYNSAIGPFFKFVLSGVSVVVGAFGKLIGVFAKIPLSKFDWARNLQGQLKGAASDASTLGNSLSHLPSGSVKLNSSQIKTAQTVAAGALVSIRRIFASSGTAKLNSSQLKAAQSAAAKVLSTLRSILTLKNKTVTVTTIYKTVGSKTGTSAATGGLLRGPGTGTSDSIPAMLSNGEYVINAKATRRNLALLHQINAQKFAGGGQAGATVSTGTGSGPLLMRVRDFGSDYITLIADDRIDAAAGFAQVVGGMSR